MFLKGIKASGTVRLCGAVVDGNIECADAKIAAAGSVALGMDAIRVGGSVYLGDGFEARGEVRLLRARVGGDLDCTKGAFLHAEGDALSAEGAEVGGSVFLSEGFTAAGRVSLVMTSVRGGLSLKQIADPSKYRLDLESADVATLQDEEKSWPPKGCLHLNGFLYSETTRDAPWDAKSRLRWLRRQQGDEIYLQPYEFLARKLGEVGATQAATQVRIAKSWDTRTAQRRQIRFPPCRWARWTWDLFLRVAFGYGYRLGATWLGLGLVLLFVGAVVFHWSSSRGMIMPMIPPQSALEQAEGPAGLAVPHFHPVLYSLDLLLPIRLGIAEKWQPDQTLNGGFAVYCFTIGLMVAGWLLVALGTATATGVLQRRT